MLIRRHGGPDNSRISVWLLVGTSYLTLDVFFNSHNSCCLSQDTYFANACRYYTNVPNERPYSTSSEFICDKPNLVTAFLHSMKFSRRYPRYDRRTEKVRPIMREGTYFPQVFLMNLHFSRSLTLIHYTWLPISVLLPLHPPCVKLLQYKRKLTC